MTDNTPDIVERLKEYDIDENAVLMLGGDEVIKLKTDVADAIAEIERLEKGLRDCETRYVHKLFDRVQWADQTDVQKVYEILCDATEPPEGEHWEGFMATRIVDALRGQGWQPIETAPKDGTEFVGLDMSEGWPFKNFTKWDSETYAGHEAGFYYVLHSVDRRWNPTHWMPIPQPPEQDDD